MRFTCFAPTRVLGITPMPRRVLVFAEKRAKSEIMTVVL